MSQSKNPDAGPEQLLQEITSLRKQVGLLEAVESEYNQRLGSLNDEYRRLENRRTWLTECLRGGPRPEPVAPKPDYTALVNPPPPAGPAADANDRPVAPPPPPPDPRRARKLALADYIEAFIPYDQRSAVMSVINALLTDADRDVGDMLELVPWGPIWTERADWEDRLKNNKLALLEWQSVLQQRLDYWRDRAGQLNTAGYDKYLRIKAKDPEAWLRQLRMEAHQQEAANLELQRTIEVLERNWEAWQAARQEAHG